VRCLLEGSFAKTILRLVDALDRLNFRKVIELPAANILDRPRRREAALEKEVRHPPHVCFARDVLGVLEN
jgi:hypothetical protein